MRRCAEGVAQYVLDRGLSRARRRGRLRPALLRASSSPRRRPRCCSPTTSRWSSRSNALPTQMTSYEVVERSAACGIVITASHNPWTDNGFKVKSTTGAAAGPKILATLEATIRDRAGIDPGAPPVRRWRGRGQGRATSTPSRATSRYVERSLDLDRLQAGGHARAGRADVGLRARAGSRASWPAAGSRSTRSTRSATPASAASIRSRSGRTSTRRWASLPAAATTWACCWTATRTAPAPPTRRARSSTSSRSWACLMYYLLEHRGLRQPVVSTVNETSMVGRLGERYGVEVHRDTGRLQVRRPEDDRDRRDDGRRGIGRLRLRHAPARARRDLCRPAAARPVHPRARGRALAGVGRRSPTSTRLPASRSTCAPTSTSTSRSTPRSRSG